MYVIITAVSKKCIDIIYLILNLCNGYWN